MIKKFKIESESGVDDYLKDLLAKPENRSMNELEYRAQELIIDEPLQKYFIRKAQELLKA